MRRVFILFIAFVLFSSHDMFLKLDGYFLEPNSIANIQLFNGTFEVSDNVITRDRMIDVSLVGNGDRTKVDTTQWSEIGEMTILNFKTGKTGTWVAGVSTRARNIEMNAEDFNGYLEHDGVIDMLALRKKNNTLDQDAVEKYSKHVKTIFQVGDKLTDDWKVALGYPIEFIPLSNPYDLHAGHELQVKLLWQGEPLANQLVYIGSDKATHDHDHDHAHAHEEDHSHAHDADDGHTHDAIAQSRTDANGVLTMNIDHEGIWYLRTIHLVESIEAGLTHESNWATLTFEIGHGHSHADDHSHADGHHHHGDEASTGVPSYVYWMGSLALVLGLFLWFNRKSA